MKESFRSYTPTSALKRYLQNLYGDAVRHNLRNIEHLLQPDRRAAYLDIGCDNGDLTLLWSKKIQTANILGVEIVEERKQLAERKGIRVKKHDINLGLPFDDNSVDAITCNQVIEHLKDSDSFLSELHRILKPGGYAVVSTENASSWCNIFASIMGWQIFSLTNFSAKSLGIGNPIALHRGQVEEWSSWTHVRIYNIRGLKEYFEVYGFDVEKIKGAGLFPLPTWAANIDTTHSHFITYKVRKPLNAIA